MDRREFLIGAASSVAVSSSVRAQSDGCAPGCTRLSGHNGASSSSMTLDFVNNIYERNGIIYPSLISLLSNGGGAFSSGLRVSQVTNSGLLARGPDELTLNVPDGAAQALVAFEDNSSRSVTGLSGAWKVPTTPAGPRIRSITFAGSAVIDTNMTSLGKAGPYSAFLGMWGMTDHSIGGTYTAGARYNKASINRDITFGWRLPGDWNGGVRGYLQISYGNYNNNDPIVEIPPRRASDLSSLEVTINHQSVGDPFSLLFEWFLTTKPHGMGGLDDIIGEIGAFPHVSLETVSWMNKQTQLGKMIDRYGRSWTVARSEDINYTTFRPTNNQDVQGRISAKDMMDFVLSKGVNVGSSYINGVAFGPEPRLGNGATKISMTVDNYE